MELVTVGETLKNVWGGHSCPPLFVVAVGLECVMPINQVLL
jgi:hypothetical protein